MTAPDPKLAKLLADLDAARVALSAHLLGASPHPLCPNEGNLVPLKIAAMVWGISQDAALRRARRSHGVKRFGRWYFPEAVVYPAREGGVI
ncbi:hypothetical protein [Methylobacterium goesingense]|uniref:DNA-binding protein n=1 Tax=Methylobacterium goesingense TaxID=243690 RepID=A0ABV2L9R2_9HYPH|nr:hypothetical protein [Methylobacterium goesingense]GJD74130.1 hypothetical protein CFIICLFH_2363 [Methylobacterium goesingense]